MPTACTSLPSPNDPSLNDPIILASLPIDYSNASEMELLLESDLQTVRELHSPRAKALMALGMESKAWRSEECGTRRFCRCANHPDQYEEQHRTCRLKTCLSCALRLSQERIEKFWDNQPYMRSLKQFHCIYIHLASQDHIPTKPEIQAFNHSVSQWIKRFGDPRPGTGAVSHVTIETPEDGLDPNRFRLVARVLWWGELPSSALARDFAPGCNTHTVQPASAIRETVKEVMTHRPPRSDDYAAEIELSTVGLRLIRSHGQMLKKELILPEDRLNEVPEALVAEEGDTATNDHRSSSHSSKCCKKCGSPFTELSNWIGPYDSVTDLSQLQWTRVAGSTCSQSPG